MKTFETGKTYQTRSLCDYDCIISITVQKRTAKTITTSEGKRFRVKPCPVHGNETVKPWGSYSMCPVISADKVAA